MLQTKDLRALSIEKNRFTKPLRIGERAELNLFYFTEPSPVVKINLANLEINLTPHEANELAANLMAASAFAANKPSAPTAEQAKAAKLVEECGADVNRLESANDDLVELLFLELHDAMTRAARLKIGLRAFGVTPGKLQEILDNV